MTGVGSSPALATCETSHVLLAGVSGGFPGVLPFRPTFRLARLDISEIILKGALTEKNNRKVIMAHLSYVVLIDLLTHDIVKYNIVCTDG